MKAAKALRPGIVFTSYLKRAIRHGLAGAGSDGPGVDAVVNDWRLNERHYGALTGLNKAETVAAHGEDQVLVWRALL